VPQVDVVEPGLAEVDVVEHGAGQCHLVEARSGHHLLLEVTHPASFPCRFRAVQGEPPGPRTW